MTLTLSRWFKLVLERYKFIEKWHSSFFTAKVDASPKFWLAALNSPKGKLLMIIIEIL